MIRLLFTALPAILLCLFTSCHGQDPVDITGTAPGTTQGVVGGAFENAEFMYIGMPEQINATDTSAGWQQDGQKLLITGTIYKLDGKTPAPGVILYYYHTDVNGLYSSVPGLDKRVARHGYIRGWVKSDENGKYAIYTVRPGSYPNSAIPAHIHPSIKEPGIDKEYWIDEFVFDDDVLLTTAERRRMQSRGGSGILRVLIDGDLQVAEHNIILGLNIPNYPEQLTEEVSSGRNIGEDNPSFMPYHAWGPDKGKRVCPVCKYGRYHGIMYFVGRQPDWADIRQWLSFLEGQSAERQRYLKAYFVYGNDSDYDEAEVRRQLEELGAELQLKHLALTFVPSFTDEQTEVNLNRINPEAENTFIIYRNRSIIDKFVNLQASPANFALISARLDATHNEYFDLPEPKHH